MAVKMVAMMAASTAHWTAAHSDDTRVACWAVRRDAKTAAKTVVLWAARKGCSKVGVLVATTVVTRVGNLGGNLAVQTAEWTAALTVYQKAA